MSVHIAAGHRPASSPFVQASRYIVSRLSKMPFSSCCTSSPFTFQIAKRFSNLVGILTRVYSTANIPRDVVQGIGQDTVPFSTCSGPLNFNGDLNGAPMRMSLGDGHGHASPSCNA